MGTDKKQQISTLTGLTPQQEKACILLASGESYTTVADELGINRSTLYKWQQSKAFQCYYNRQCQEYKDEVKNGIFGLHGKAIATLKELIEKGNDSSRLKASMWILDKIETSNVEDSDIRKVLKRLCTVKTMWGDSIFDEKKYNQMLEQYGLSHDE